MAAPLADVAARKTGERFWRRAGRLLLWGGVVSGVAASAIGMVDYLAAREVPRLPSAHLHAGGNALALALAAINLSRRPTDDAEAPGGVEMGLSLSTLALLGATAWLGGELSFRHGIGMIADDGLTTTQEIVRA